eukprot:9550902-Prorocentrum_lima.AAC.1
MAAGKDTLASLLKPKNEGRRLKFDATLQPPQRTLWHSQSAPGAAAFMTAPTEDVQLMSDAAFSMTLRRRLLMTDAE